MKISRFLSLTTLAVCSILFVFSCTTDEKITHTQTQEQLFHEVQSPMVKVESSKSNAASRTWICWKQMQYIQYGGAPECASQAAQKLEEEYHNFFADKSDYGVYLNMYYQIYLWGVIVSCDEGCTNCNNYLDLAYQFAQCLEDNDSPYTGGLDWIIDYLEEQCEGCPLEDCCPEATFDISSTTDSNGCCAVTLNHNIPETCGNITTLENQWGLGEGHNCQTKVSQTSNSITYTFCCDEGADNAQTIRFHASVGDCDLYTDYVNVGCQ